MKVEEAIKELRAAAEALQAEFPDLAADEVAWIDTLDGVTNGLDLAEWLAERCIRAQAMEEAARKRAGDIEKRAQRFARQQTHLRGIVQLLLEAAGGKSLVRPTLTISLRDTPKKLVEIDASQTPKALMRQPPAVPDKTEITRKLKEGEAVPGWQLSNGGRTAVILTR